MPLPVGPPTHDVRMTLQVLRQQTMLIREQNVAPALHRRRHHDATRVAVASMLALIDSQMQSLQASTVSAADFNTVASSAQPSLEERVAALEQKQALADNDMQQEIIRLQAQVQYFLDLYVEAAAMCNAVLEGRPVEVLQGIVRTYMKVSPVIERVKKVEIL